RFKLQSTVSLRRFFQQYRPVADPGAAARSRLIQRFKPCPRTKVSRPPIGYGTCGKPPRLRFSSACVTIERPSYEHATGAVLAASELAPMVGGLRPFWVWRGLGAFWGPLAPQVRVRFN